MNKSKKGISLIVLVITIIVIIILAAAIILSLQNNNPIAKASEAVTASDLSEAQSAYTLWLGSVMADELNVVTLKDDSTDGTGTVITSTPKNVTVIVGTDPTNTKIIENVSTSTFGLSSVTSMKIKDNEVKELTKTK